MSTHPEAGPLSLAVTSPGQSPTSSFLTEPLSLTVLFHLASLPFCSPGDSRESFVPATLWSFEPSSQGGAGVESKGRQQLHEARGISAAGARGGQGGATRLAQARPHSRHSLRGWRGHSSPGLRSLLLHLFGLATGSPPPGGAFQAWEPETALGSNPVSAPSVSG